MPEEPLKVRNYYTFTTEDLEEAIEDIKAWFLNAPTAKHAAKVNLALAVALCAREISYQEKDPFLLLVIDSLT